MFGLGDRRMTAAREHPIGYEVLRNPQLNKGTAFTEEERRKYRLEGLLPPAVTTIELQVARRRAEIAALDNDLQKYLVLSDLQSRNETLFYAVVMSDLATYMPLVYTPTVGEACQKFAHIFRQARGLYLPISARGRPASCCRIGRNGRFASLSSPTGSASSASAISGRAAWEYRSASLPSTPPVRACRRNTACRWFLTSAPTTRPCSTTRSIRGYADTGCAATNTWRLSTNSLWPCSSSIRIAAFSGRILPV